ncbi:MAG: hypothetical protein HPY66_1687 [Firmicutes bacterium]|nr:hypothetical protein [Bacillota bacterium]
MSDRIQDQEWFRKTVAELREYRVLIRRIEVIEIMLRRNAGPDAKVIANYGMTTGAGQNPDEINPLEVELEMKQTKLKAIDASLEALEPREKQIIELKFKQGKRDQEIYEGMQIAKATFYADYNPAIEKLAKVLGYLEC